jgi:tricorn protease
MDGGRLVVSEDAMYGLKSQWVVENVGVSPDITVHDEPGDLNHGRDAQLNTAVNLLMKKIHDSPRPLPHPPAWTPAFPPQPPYPKCSDHMNNATCG